MDSRLAVAGLGALAALALVVLAGGPTDGADPLGAALDGDAGADRGIELNVTALPCPDGYDNQADDDLCLGYDGQVPGPPLVLGTGDRVELTLEHDVADSLEGVDAPEQAAQRLAEARYTHHRHGVSAATCEDGTARILGTDMCDSSVGPPGAPEPAGSVTYTFETPFEGPWHYHDHTLGVDAGTALRPVIEEEGMDRGLYGSMLVLEDPSATDRVLDLHLLDSGPNGGLGLNATVDAGDRFDLVVVGLGDLRWEVTLAHSEQGTVDELAIGPGVSRAITVEDARPGTYTWTAGSPQAGVYEGEVQIP
jgi:FtsP/CotA-like multicopper oxidase with cupredoxin domain